MRSISYTSRSFDNLNHGEAYDKVLPVTHIGFLNFTLFPDYPEFYAGYQLMNEKKFYVYSDKFRISVVDLSQIELATEEDKTYGIDLWAHVFSATTWEEIEMLAQNNEYLQETVSGVRQLTAEEQIRQQCQAREDYLYWERIKAAETRRIMAEKDAIIAEQQAELTAQQAELTAQQAELEELRAFKAAHLNNIRTN
ncbi:MAG: PD-(D/E)XK nuclease family transposase [Lachnospiraceae bacterium]|nr:PD-(D/E)XK nuclease family transposase [Lachnospiraceae bacterium]